MLEAGNFSLSAVLLGIAVDSSDMGNVLCHVHMQATEVKAAGDRDK